MYGGFPAIVFLFLKYEGVFLMANENVQMWTELNID